MPDPSSSSSSGSSVTITGLPDVIITGFTLPLESSTLGPIIMVGVDPPSFASDIDYAIEGTNRVDITDWTIGGHAVAPGIVDRFLLLASDCSKILLTWNSDPPPCAP